MKISRGSEWFGLPTHIMCNHLQRDRKKKPTAIAMVMSGRSAKAGAQPHAESGGATGCQSHEDEGWDWLESVNTLVWSQGSILDDVRLHAAL